MYLQQTQKLEHKVSTNDELRSKNTKYVHQQQTNKS